MNAKSNKELVRGFFDDILAGRMSDAWSRMGEDMTWIFPGHNPVSGTYTRQELEKKVISRILSRCPNGQHYNFKAFTAEDDRVVVEFETVGNTTDGKVFNNHYHLVYVVRDGLIRECREYFDTYHFAELILGSHSSVHIDELQV